MLSPETRTKKKISKPSKTSKHSTTLKTPKTPLKKPTPSSPLKSHSKKQNPPITRFGPKTGGAPGFFRRCFGGLCRSIADDVQPRSQPQSSQQPQQPQQQRVQSSRSSQSSQSSQSRQYRQVFGQEGQKANVWAKETDNPQSEWMKVMGPYPMQWCRDMATGMNISDPGRQYIALPEDTSKTSNTPYTCNKPEECSICLEDVERPPGVPLEMRQGLVGWVETSCGHQFHKVCLNKWFENHDSCPVCRNPARMSRCHQCDDTTSRQVRAGGRGKNDHISRQINVGRSAGSSNKVKKPKTSPKKPMKSKKAVPKRKRSIIRRWVKVTRAGSPTS